MQDAMCAMPCIKLCRMACRDKLTLCPFLSTSVTAFAIQSCKQVPPLAQPQQQKQKLNLAHGVVLLQLQAALAELLAHTAERSSTFATVRIAAYTPNT